LVVGDAPEWQPSGASPTTNHQPPATFSDPLFFVAQTETILVLGIGNLLWADEGFGVRAAEAFDRLYACGEGVTVMDGGTQGMYLLPHVQEASRLIVFDAIDYGLEPGTMKVVLDGDVPSYMGAKQMSLHQTGFQDVLAAAQLTGQCPSHIVLIGVQPVELKDYGGSLREPVRARIGPAVETAVEWLRRWGVEVTPRDSAAQVAVNASALDLDAYESGRPSQEEACRVGDPRFLPRRND
jgi:hydrogenase maturation protease